jgi:large subunit ribosomal protein L4
MNMQIDIFDQTGSKVSKHTLTPEIFEADINIPLMHQALTVQASNRRQGTSKTKTKGEVRGGGRKPWKQKGTGRARVGSTRSPIWRGGGITFGPTGEQNFAKDMPKNQRRKALFSVLSQKAKDNSIIGIKTIDENNLKTKIVNQLIDKLPIERNALIVIPNSDDRLKRAFSNIPYAQVVMANYLDIHDLMKYETIVFLEESFSVVDATWKEYAVKLYSSRKSLLRREIVAASSKTVKKTVKTDAKVEPAKEVVKKAEVKKVVEKKDVVKKPVVKKPVVKKTVAKKVERKVTKKVKE